MKTKNTKQTEKVNPYEEIMRSLIFENLDEDKLQKINQSIPKPQVRHKLWKEALLEGWGNPPLELGIQANFTFKHTYEVYKK